MDIFRKRDSFYIFFGYEFYPSVFATLYTFDTKNFVNSIVSVTFASLKIPADFFIFVVSFLGEPLIPVHFAAVVGGLTVVLNCCIATIVAILKIILIMIIGSEPFILSLCL